VTLRTDARAEPGTHRAAMKRRGSPRRPWLAVLGAALLLLLAVMGVRTLMLGSRQLPVAPAPPVKVDAAQIARRVGAAVAFQTISTADPARTPHAAFAGLRAFLVRTYPRSFAAFQEERIGDSLLLTLPGSDAALPPVLLMAHQDVVPVEASSRAAWTHPPFAGAITDGYVWGRGTLDDKGCLIAMLEATESLLGAGFQPRRTLMLAFGADEEVGGQGGNGKIAALLQARGVRLQSVLDEGGLVLPGTELNVRPDVAMVGIAEKGVVSLELTVRGPGGHSSMPPRHTVIGVLGEAIRNLEAQPFPARLDGATAQFLDRLGPESPLLRRVAIANRWLLDGAVMSQLAAKPSTDAIQRTTTAVTMIDGGVKENVLPAQARAVVNFRILPGESIASVEEHARRVIHDPQVQIRRLETVSAEPSPVSSTASASFRKLETTIREMLPGALVAPNLTVGMTDSRHYLPISEGVYRFIPYRLTLEDTHRVHGVDERLSVEDCGRMARFYQQLIRSSTR
jgi:carboxypeptidase PM20D1